MNSSRPVNNLRDSAFVGLRSSMTLEEVDCERRGYKLTKTVLGTGAYAKVKLAYVMENKLEKDKRLAEDLVEKGHNMVAIKLICKKKAPPEYLSKFMPREIDSLNATCRHHNVIQLYETFHTETKIFLVMEYASRGDLLDYINARTRRGIGIGEEVAKKFFRQLAEGVAHCHRRNIVHRDLKCENILLDQDNIVKVSDFGFATRYPTNKCKLLSTFCGSYAYAAPEILQEQKYDGKCADVWSLGIVLYVMVCGRLPFNDSSLHSLIAQTRGKLAFPAGNLCSPECRHMIRSILTRDPRKRVTMAQVLGHSWLSGEGSKVLSVTGQTKLDKKRMTLTSIQKEVEQALEEKTFSSTAEPLVAVKQAERYSAAKTPVPKHGWSSSGNTPKPHTTAKLLHKRDARLASKSPTLDSIRIESPIGETPAVEPPRSTTPCPQSFTPTSQPKLPKKRELAVKVAQILTETGYQSRPTNLCRETYVIMNKALQGSQRTGQTKSDFRGDGTQRVWKYVTNLSSNGRASVTPAVPDVIPPPKAKDQAQSPANLPSIPVYLKALTPSPPTTDKSVKNTVPCRQLNLFPMERMCSPQVDPKEAGPTASAQVVKSTGQERSRSDLEPQETNTYKPYLMNLALQNSSKTRPLRLSTTRESSEKNPKAKQAEKLHEFGLNHLRAYKGKGKAHTSLIRNQKLRGGLRKGSSTVSNTDRKHVRFQ